MTERGRCRECGCTDDRACTRLDLLGLPESCSWAEPDLCTACIPHAIGWLHPTEQPDVAQIAAETVAGRLIDAARQTARAAGCTCQPHVKLTPSAKRPGMYDADVAHDDWCPLVAAGGPSQN